MFPRQRQRPIWRRYFLLAAIIAPLAWHAGPRSFLGASFRVLPSSRALSAVTATAAGSALRDALLQSKPAEVKVEVEAEAEAPVEAEAEAPAEVKVEVEAEAEAPVEAEAEAPAEAEVMPDAAALATQEETGLAESAPALEANVVASLLGAEEEEPEVVTARIERGEMHFLDFLGMNHVMQKNPMGQMQGAIGPMGRDITNAMVPAGGYEQMVGAMTKEEMFSPDLFKPSEAGSAERISRVAEKGGMDWTTVNTFLSDFGSIQSFFAKAALGGSDKSIARALLSEQADTAAVMLDGTTRKSKRSFEKKSKILKEAGERLRGEQATTQIKKRKGFR